MDLPHTLNPNPSSTANRTSEMTWQNIEDALLRRSAQSAVHCLQHRCLGLVKRLYKVCAYVDAALGTTKACVDKELLHAAHCFIILTRKLP